MRRVDRIRVPLFVGHGHKDTVANIAQGQHLVSELKRHGKPHVVHFERSEGHGMAYFENRVELYAAIERFLAENLTRRPPPSPPRDSPTPQRCVTPKPQRTQIRRVSRHARAASFRG